MNPCICSPSVVFYRNAPIRHGGAVYRSYGITQASTRRLHDHFLLVEKTKGYVRVGQHDAQHDVADPSGLGGYAFGKFQSGPAYCKKGFCTVKAVPSGHPQDRCDMICPPWISMRLPICAFCVRDTASTLDTARDGTKRFAAETQRLDAHERIATSYLPCSHDVSKCQRQVLRHNTTSVIHNAALLSRPPPLDLDGDGGGTCIQRILTQFLDHAIRPIYHFARSDSVAGFQYRVFGFS